MTIILKDEKDSYPDVSVWLERGCDGHVHLVAHNKDVGRYSLLKLEQGKPVKLYAGVSQKLGFPVTPGNRLLVENW